MTTLSILWLGALGVIFALWVFAMFVTLFRLRADFVASLPPGKGPFSPDVPRTLTTFGRFFHDPKYRPDRWRVIPLTCLLFAVIGLGPLLLGGAR